jgi:N utilization substance protein B
VGSRRQAREQALQILYQLDVTRDPAHQEVSRVFWSVTPADADVVEFADSVVAGVCAQTERIDALITEASHNWKVARMSYVDRNILRLAVFEFLEKADVPPMVSINEAIELGKRFGTNESGAFINGILDRIARGLNLTGEKTS